jgi:GT2 family glycosyltransferase
VSAASEQTLPASVIVPTRGRPKLIVECVQSILEGEQVPCELVVVDQSPDDNHVLAEMGTVRGCAVRYRRSASRGVSAARNEACELATEDILVFTDDDVLVAPDWLGETVRSVLADPISTLITGRVLSIDKHGSGGFAPTLIEGEEPRVYEGRIWNEVLPSNNMAFARAVFERLGPFDIRLGVGGTYRSSTDNDYCFRALEAGYRIRYVPEAVVYHQAWRPKKSLPQVRWAYGVGLGAYFTKHTGLNDRYMLIRLRNAILRHTRIAWENRSGDPHAAKAEAAYALGLIYGSLRWLVMETLRRR